MLYKKRLFTPGPTMMPRNISLAMAQEMLHHRKPEFKALYEKTAVCLGRVFGTGQPVLPLSCSGTGAMVAAVCSLFAEGDRVIAIDGGKFGSRWLEICQAHKVEAVHHAVPWGQSVNPDDIEALLDADPSIKGVLAQLSETSTGVLHRVRELAAITRKRKVLLVVDGISAVAVSPCPMDEWGIDCLLTGSQKGLMLPPGLALIALSARAWEWAEAVGPRNFYFNLLAERKNYEKRQTHFTSPVSLMVGLAECLALFDEFTIEQVYRKQWALTCLIRAGVSALGLELFVKEHYAWGVTSVKLPEGVAAPDLIARAAKQYGVIMAGGSDEYKGSMVRIGHMGWIDAFELAGCLYALASAFTDCGGYLGCRNYMEQAMKAYEKALKEGCPAL